MKEYKEFLAEKTHIRLTDPDRYLALTMILDRASKLAKAEQVEVTEDHLIQAVRSEIAANKKAIEDIKGVSLDKDVSEYESKIKNLEVFMPAQMSEVMLKDLLSSLIEVTPEDMRVKKNTKTLMVLFLKTLMDKGILESSIDQKLAARFLSQMLK